MPDGRMLKKKISLNEAVADLANDTHRLLFTWAIPHLDSSGRISGSPRRFRATVCPLLDHIDNQTVEAFFQDAGSKGLIEHYQVDGVWVVQYPKFRDNQKIIPDREASSKYPEKPANYESSSVTQESSRVTRECSGETQDSSGLTPPNLTQLNSTKPKASACVAGPAAPVDDATPPEAEVSVLVVVNGGQGANATKPKFGPASLFELWNSLGCRPLVSELTDERRKKAGLRLRKRGDPDWWRRLFEKARELNKPWLTFDFLLKNDTNCLKLLEGNYDHDFGNRGNGRGQKTGPPGERAPRGYDQRRHHYVVEVPDPE